MIRSLIKRDFCGLKFKIGTKEAMIQRITWDEPRGYNTKGRIWFGHKISPGQVNGKDVIIESGMVKKVLKNVRVTENHLIIEPFVPTSVIIEEIVSIPAIGKFNSEGKETCK